jgi:hypothetical protein|tara:strand:+ start:5875 stop:6417 length:543 start_codon:yes stop_codon:yes gene_type:complete
MSELRLVVDHLRLNYKGPFNANDLIKNIYAFLKERGFDMHNLKDFENNTKTGKQMEWQVRPWKKISDYGRLWPNIRVLVKDYNKVDAMVDNKKIKIGSGSVEIYIDGYLELDEQQRWEVIPFFQFLRSLYNTFFYKVYTERFEQRLSYDMNHLYHTLEQFFNMYKHYKVVSKVPPFISAH